MSSAALSPHPVPAELELTPRDVPPFVVIGNPGTRRVRGVEAALAGLGLPPARLVPYADLLANRVHLAEVVTPGAVVRIESPDEEPEVQRAILALGEAPAAAEGDDYLTTEQAAAALADKGRLLPSRQWYLGFCTLLRDLDRQRALCPPHRLMNAPEDVAVMFDKRRCHALLAASEIPVPRALNSSGVHDYGSLTEAMRTAGMSRVFVKPAHGSSASGVVAYQTNGREHLATTTAEAVWHGGTLRRYNSKKVRTYRDAEVRPLLDALCRQPVHVERWVPKAGLDGRVFDLRVVVIHGRAHHTVARLSRTPLTNLHLDHERRGTAAVQERMGEQAWSDAMRSCERAMALFPHSLYAGVDLLISTDFQRHAILEMNAFGDLLLNTFCDGQDTYTAEILSVLQDLSASHSVGAAPISTLAPWDHPPC